MKTKLPLFLIISFLFLNSFSQDYACIKPLDTVYFNHNYYPISSSIHVPVIIENTTISNDTIYHQNISDWAFRNITIAPDGVSLFTNQNLDTISISTQANINDSWVFYTYPNNNYLEATVTSIAQESFIEITDDVKRIDLQLKDSDGNNLSGSINNNYIKISKNHGFIHVPNLSLFPNGKCMNIIAYNDSNIDNFGSAEIFDFNIDDEFHTTEDVEKWYTPEGWEYYHEGVDKIAKVIAKNTSGDGTKITYTYNVCSKYFLEIRNQYSNSDDIVIETIDLTIPEYDCFNNISTTSHDYIDETGYCKRIVIGADSDSKFIISIAEGYDINNLTITFPDFNPYTPDGYPYHYKIGKGGPYYFHLYNANWAEGRYLTNHISCSHLLETEELDINNDFNIYPNPVNNNLYLRLNTMNNTLYSIIITDITGKKHLKENNNTNEFTIDTSKLIDGLYILQLVSDQGVLTKKFMVRH